MIEMMTATLMTVMVSVACLIVIRRLVWRCHLRRLKQASTFIEGIVFCEGETYPTLWDASVAFWRRNGAPARLRYAYPHCITIRCRSTALWVGFLAYLTALGLHPRPVRPPMFHTGYDYRDIMNRYTASPTPHERPSRRALPIPTGDSPRIRYGQERWEQADAMFAAMVTAVS